MFRTIGIVVVCLCLVGGAGLYFNWFTISPSNTDSQSGVRLSMNKDKVENAEKSVKDEYHNLFGDKTMKGTIREIEPANKELIVRDNANKDVTIKLDAATKITIIDKDGSFVDLKTDDPVSVKYESNKDGNVARTITVAKKL